MNRSESERRGSDFVRYAFLMETEVVNLYHEPFRKRTARE